jgi:hypothetical protein
MLDERYEEYFTYDEPIPLNGLFLYPVKMRNYIDFHKNIGCLLINKNRIPDPNIISMSYLDFILAMSVQNNNFLFMFENLIYLCFRLDRDHYFIDYGYDQKNKAFFEIKKYKKNSKNEDDWKILNTWHFSYKDFKLIRELICFQNSIEMPDEKIDPKLEKALLEAQEYLNKQRNHLKIISLEDVMINAHLDFEKIYQLSIRKFIKILSRYDKELHYKIYMQASMSGFVEFKKPITHYMYDSNEDKYAALVTPYDEFKDKVSSVANTK